jgi:gamma-glutamylputrescine oxidase
VAASLWLEEPAEPLRTQRRDSAIDVAVVGGGVTGLSCALTLAEDGKRVRVYEARTIASGASGRSGGFALRGGAMPYDQARGRLGAEQAAETGRLTERAWIGWRGWPAMRSGVSAASAWPQTNKSARSS